MGHQAARIEKIPAVSYHHIRQQDPYRRGKVREAAKHDGKWVPEINSVSGKEDGTALVEVFLRHRNAALYCSPDVLGTEKPFRSLLKKA
jgi:hypothetical protein